MGDAVIEAIYIQLLGDTKHIHPSLLFNHIILSVHNDHSPINWPITVYLIVFVTGSNWFPFLCNSIFVT